MSAHTVGGRRRERPERRGVDPAPHPPSPGLDATDARPVLTLGEAGGLVLAVAVAMVATASLALAVLGRHDGRTAVALGLTATVMLVPVAWRSGRRPALVVDRVEIALVGAVAIGAALFFLPGFPYASVDKDPGVYVAHAFAIARDGDVTIDDPVLERGLDPYVSQAGRLPGLWVEPDAPGAVTSQFYHLYPATLATAGDLVGSPGVFHLTPLLAVVSVCLLAVAVRRAAGTAVAAVFGALLVTSMMQVWQARYPSTEMLAQFLLAGALLGGVVAVERRWAGGAFAAGVLLGIGFLCRPDGFLYILLAAGVVGLAVAARRVDRRSAMLGVGLALTFPFAAWNAYELRARYTASNSVPGLPVLVLACGLIVGSGLAVRSLVSLVDRRRGRIAGVGAGVGAGADDGPGGSADRAGYRRSDGGLLPLLARGRRPLGVVAGALAGLVLLGLWHREALLGTHYVYSPFVGRTIPSLDEINIKWLSWFLTMRGLVLTWLGVLVVALTRTRAAVHVLVLPGAALLPVYLWDARISMRLMWWVRRFVPAVLPAVVLLIAMAVGWALLHRLRTLRVVGGVAALTLVAGFASQSLPLRGHQEMAGSWEAAEAVAEFAGDEQGVFLYTSSTGTEDPMRNTPAAVWFIFDQVVSRLHPGYGIDDIDAYRDAFPGQPVFLVTHGALPTRLPAARFVEAGTVTQQLTMWEESQSEVPDGAHVVRADLVLWRLTG